MLDFIEVTTKILKDKLPENTPISYVDYSCRYGVLKSHFCFYDKQFKKKAFDFMFYDVPGTKPIKNLTYAFEDFVDNVVLSLL